VTLQRSALVSNGIGAIVSVASLGYVGARFGSNAAQPVVMILIAIWVISPFVILFALHRLSASWSSAARTTLYSLMLIVTVISLAVYLSQAAGPVKPKPAAPFVALPPAAWLLIAISLGVGAVMGRRRV
jgi:uncharacterized membrane protein